MTSLRVAIVILGVCACRFDADYSGGHYRCSDGVCPSGLVCESQLCVEPGGAPDAEPIDARLLARNCAEPEPITRGVSMTFHGDTTGKADHVTGMCATHNLLGPDDEFIATAQAGDRADVDVEGDAIVRGYVTLTCAQSVTCDGDMLAMPGNPIAVTGLPAGDVTIVVDTDDAALGAAYTLTVRVGP